MHLLHLLGSLSLEDPSRASPASVVGQRPLAVLALLAVARDKGCSREKLVGYLWPDVDQERARHRLADAVYVIRKSLGEDSVLGVGDTLRLNPEVVQVDVSGFLDALDSDELQAGVSFYGGPFLDGFYVSGAPEFERWVAVERQRFGDAYAGALEELAQRAEATGDFRRAVDWWKRLAAHDPYNSRCVLRLMQALASAGDRGNALQLAQEHERRLSEELGIEPDAEFRALMERLRSDAGVAAEPFGPAIPAAPPVHTLESEGASDRWLTWRKRLPAAALSVAAVVAAVLTIHGLRTPDPGAALNPTRVAVLPFSVRGNEELAYLKEGMADLLAMALDEAGELATVDQRAVIGFVRRETSGSLDPETGRDVAARFGAGRYILGDILAVGGQIRASASLYDQSGEPRTTAQAVVDDEARILELVDEVARQLVVASTDSATDRLTRLGATTTESLTAMKAYLRGESLFRSGWFNPAVADSAVAEYKRAVAADTAFALAYFRMAVLQSFSTVSLDVGNAAELAHRFSARLPRRQRRLLECFAAFKRSDGEEAEDRCQAVLRDDPNNAGAWWWLGDALHHYGLRRGRALDEVKAAYERALALEPSHQGVLSHLSWLALVEENPTQWAAYWERRQAVLPQHPRARTGRLLVAAWRGDEEALETLIAWLQSQDPWTIYIASHHTWPLEDRAATIRILRLITAPEQSRPWRAYGHVMIAHEELAAGRLAAARAELAEAQALNPDPSLRSKVYLLLSPYLRVTAEDLAGLRDEVVAWNPVTRPDSVWQLYLLGLLYERLDESSETQQLASELDAMAFTLIARNDTLSGALAEDLALYLRARLAAGKGHHEEALASLQRTSPERWWPNMSGTAYWKQIYERWLTADVLVALDRREEALHWLAAFGMDGERSYMGIRHFRMAEIYEELGNRERALYHYGRFVTYWKDADPELQPRVEAARRAIEALSPDT